MPVSDHGHSLARDIHVALGGLGVEHSLDRAHGGDVRAWAERARIDPAEIIDFSASINPLGPPFPARQAFQKSYKTISRYPDPYGEELKEALAKHHGMKPAEILVGNGSTQLIYLLSSALRPREALIVCPAFSEYANALELAGAKVHFLPLACNHGFTFCAEKFIAAWTKAIDIALLATPNSVTGQLISRAAVEKIAGVALRKRKFLVIDEAFVDFVEAESVKQLARDNPYVIVLRSLTKYYALPGLRLGYLFGHPRTIAQLAAFLEPWSVNGPAQKVAVASLADQSFAMKTERWLHRERNFLKRALTALKQFQPYPSSANFMLVRMVADCADASELRFFLLRRKILIRACNSFLGLGIDHFRVAIRRRKDNLQLIEALRQWRPLAHS